MPQDNENKPVDLVIPAFNEQDNITPLANAIPTQLFRKIYLVDNGSTDNTAKMAKQVGFEVLHESSRGYGSACLAALDEIAKQDEKPYAVAFLDADLSDDPLRMRDLLAPLFRGTAVLVIASRTKLASPGSLTFTQVFGNALACFMLRLATGYRYSDLGPMRAMRYEELVSLHMKDKTWGWTVEMQYKVAARKMSFVEIDVPYRNRHAGRSKISGSITGSIKAGYKIITTILKLYLRYRASDKNHTIPSD